MEWKFSHVPKQVITVSLGIEHGKCIDDALLKDQFGIDIEYKKTKLRDRLVGVLRVRILV
ncbi:MAG: hypothetical protein IPN18_06980 [Ignavibacteriales bacterium]|nr:hypothetical protein [Ignavibacteriales bacterium]